MILYGSIVLMNLKAIIFDLDGTAIPNKPNGLPSRAVISSVQQAKDAIHLCAATGRPITNAKPIIDALGLTDPCIISGGTQIVNPVSGEILWECHLEADDVQTVLNICHNYPHEVLIKNEVMGQGAPAAERAIDEPVNVMYIMQCTDEDGQKIVAELAKVPTVTASAVISWTGEGLDIHVTHREATKEHAVHELRRMLHVSREEVAGVGDANNDIHLFKAVGTKVAMGNATELLKSQADIVIDSVDKDGLAKYINHITGEI